MNEANEAMPLVIKEEYILRKFDGDKQEGQLPVELRLLTYVNKNVVADVTFTDPEVIAETEKMLAEKASNKEK